MKKKIEVCYHRQLFFFLETLQRNFKQSSLYSSREHVGILMNMQDV